MYILAGVVVYDESAEAGAAKAAKRNEDQPWLEAFQRAKAAAATEAKMQADDDAPKASIRREQRASDRDAHAI
eukprot:2981836-Pleurochrysis_carterae.AAC.1